MIHSYVVRACASTGNFKVAEFCKHARYTAMYAGISRNTSINKSDVENRNPRVAFQGTHGAFSELAIRQYWPHHADVLPQQTFTNAVNSVLSREADFAVIPVENAIVGPVHVALAALRAADDQLILGESIKLEIRLCLMAPAGAALSSLREVLSHPVALAQCGTFFAQHPWLTPIVHVDTGSAACDVSKTGELHRGAIASDTTAALYGLEIIENNIADLKTNWTRFVVVRAR